MLKKIITLLGIVLFISCQTRKPELLPPSGPYFQSLSIKFNFNDGESKQNGRIHWRFDDRSSKFLFFTPLNQVGLELNADGEAAVLLNFAKKIFWKGEFVSLLHQLWGIELNLDDLKQILVKGLVPQTKLASKGISVSLKNDSQTGIPETVRFRRGAADLTLRISRREFSPGKIILINYSGRYQAADLESVLGDD
ncbi:MAG: hypothetical protein MUP71_02775 [Candidatus Aminicenantes bacterium]|nr:hypothetical protein [Candidatus Aminicenantes bacterium]